MCRTGPGRRTTRVPDEALDAKDETAHFGAALEEALSRIPPRRAQIVRFWVASDFGDMSIIAESLGISRQAVSLSIKLALPRLRDVLEGDERLEGFGDRQDLKD